MSFRTMNRLTGWALGLVATGVYLRTMEASGSFWDCGEFIACAAKVGVPHPPGAPLFVLLGRMAILLSGSPAVAVNALSAICSGLTIAFLFWTITLLARRYLTDPVLLLVSGAVGALTFTFTDTFWFNAVEAEVYATSSLFTAMVFWSALKWWESGEDRWLVLIGFLAGLSFGVHELTLLTIPSVILIGYFRRPRLKRICIALGFFLVGATSYITVVERGGDQVHGIRGLEDYLGRDQYGGYPLVYGKDYTGHQMWFPRIWDQNSAYYAQWLGIRNHERDPNQWDNLGFFFGYQLGWMYGRYFLWNFSGRQNDLQGYGAPRDGNAITGFPFIDNPLLGDQSTLPDSLRSGRTRLFALPLLLGLLGCIAQFRRSRKEWYVTALLFVFTGVAIVVYLNQPGNQPRERDYAYVGSFYTFAIWIGLGAVALRRRWATALCLGVPVLVALQEWRWHDRGRKTLAFDLAYDYLQSCPPDAVLFTFEDNDTYPLWFAQEAMGVRPDVQVVNTSLLFENWYAREQFPGLEFTMPRGRVERVIAANHGKRPLCFTRRYEGQGFERTLWREGLVYELGPDTDHAGVDRSRDLLLHAFRFCPPVYLDEENRRQLLFLRQAYIDVADSLPAPEAREVLETADRNIHMPYGCCSKFQGYHDLESLAFARAGFRAGDPVLARRAAAGTASDCTQEIYYYEHLPAARKTPGSDQEAQYLTAKLILDSLRGR